MSWSYSGDPTDSYVDAVRFFVQDTNTDDQLLSDEEISFLITHWSEYDSMIFVAAMAAETIASRFAREITVSADGVSVGTNELQQKYLGLAKQLRAQYLLEQVTGAPESFGNNFGEEFDASIKPLSFGVGLLDNSEIGTQDYGGTRVIPSSEEFRP